ncbi:hypothetical protein AVEN_93576-1 [Araneus ventricosus]|uniref:Uncharacterized protein n=1 Tax=Araneus ventricosus TaxID=182803 RepID=A0A4Y2AS81_ARAVE|nr:hypothetical protein AVEN_93576-1 [Araneus ventricosus]
MAGLTTVLAFALRTDEQSLDFRCYLFARGAIVIGANSHKGGLGGLLAKSRSQKGEIQGSKPDSIKDFRACGGLVHVRIDVESQTPSCWYDAEI